MIKSDLLLDLSSFEKLGQEKWTTMKVPFPSILYNKIVLKWKNSKHKNFINLDHMIPKPEFN
jgi:hypothetical protein